jgi:hypothetical protein
MKVKCYICGKTAHGTQEQLAPGGWCGFDGKMNGKRFKFDLCGEHIDQAPKVLEAIKAGREVLRMASGDYVNAEKK